MKKREQKRADELLVERGLASDLHEAIALIMADKVRTGIDDGIVVNKPGMLLARDASLTLRRSKPYVSRGGFKLAAALDAFGIDVSGMRCVDLGASTGGFTDCLLQRGAKSVRAIDVGYGQLAHRLRTDPRVTVDDRTNIRLIDPRDFGAPFDMVVADLSFIALAAVAEQLAGFAGGTGRCILLVKPQFEVGRDEVGERGIVTDPALHEQVLIDTIAALDRAGLKTSNLTCSPVKGASGNIEYLLLCGRNERRLADVTGTVAHTVSHTVTGAPAHPIG